MVAVYTQYLIILAITLTLFLVFSIPVWSILGAIINKANWWRFALKALLIQFALSVVIFILASIWAANQLVNLGY